MVTVTLKNCPSRPGRILFEETLQLWGWNMASVVKVRSILWKKIRGVWRSVLQQVSQSQLWPQSHDFDPDQSRVRNSYIVTIYLLFMKCSSNGFPRIWNLTGVYWKYVNHTTNCHNFWGVSGRNHLKVYTSHNVDSSRLRGQSHAWPLTPTQNRVMQYTGQNTP